MSGSAKNRTNFGAGHWKAKLTFLQVEEMRDLHEYQGWTWRQLARRFQCSREAARDIVSYRRRCYG